MAVAELELEEDKYVSLLEKLIGEVKHLQNNPPAQIAKEDRAGRHVLETLQPFSEEQGGPLKMKHVSYVEGRGNIIVEYPGTDEGRIMSFVGCHLDVVPANPEDWEWDPFSLSRDGDKLRGRGVTDCLGHVALLTEFFRQLAISKPKLKTTVVGVWIANEENATDLGIGVDGLVAEGLLDHLKAGPLFWLDVADKQPCIGTGGMAAWKLTAKGKLFHSGLPHKGINAMELAMVALEEIQKRFYRDFPAHPLEEKYGFATPSTLKPTQWSYPGGSVNQIPGECTLCGDIRVTPFYSMEEVAKKVQEYVEDINAHVEDLPVRGPVAKYVLPEDNLRGKLELKFEDVMMSGVACKLDSPGFAALCQATETVIGHVKPFSITGSLPLIRELQDAGFDVQTMGYGVLSTYHARNEYGLLSDFKQGFKVMGHVVDKLNEH